MCSGVIDIVETNFSKSPMDQTSEELIIIAVDLDLLNHIEVCRRIITERPTANVLVWTDSCHATKYHNQLMRAGARGFCLKDSPRETLVEAVQQVSAGLPFCDPAITALVKQSP